MSMEDIPHHNDNNPISEEAMDVADLQLECEKIKEKIALAKMEVQRLEAMHAERMRRIESMKQAL